MDENPVYVLIHSPLVGGLTWTLVAEQMQQRGQSVVVPILSDSADSQAPYWEQHAESVAQAFQNFPQDIALILVAHSGAGPLLPIIRQSIPNPIQAYVFVDAGIPRDGATRLDLMMSEDPEWARQFREKLKRGEQFPTWSSDDLRQIVRTRICAQSWSMKFIRVGWISLQNQFPYFASGQMRLAFISSLARPMKDQLLRQARLAGQLMN